MLASFVPGTNPQAAPGSLHRSKTSKLHIEKRNTSRDHKPGQISKPHTKKDNGKHKPTDRPGSSGKEECPSFFLVDLQKLLSGFIRGLDVPWLHTGNSQHIAGTKKQATGPAKDTGPVKIVQYRANMKAGL